MSPDSSHPVGTHSQKGRLFGSTDGPTGLGGQCSSLMARRPGMTKSGVEESGTVAETQEAVQAPSPPLRIQAAPGNLRQAQRQASPW